MHLLVLLLIALLWPTVVEADGGGCPPGVTGHCPQPQPPVVNLWKRCPNGDRILRSEECPIYGSVENPAADTPQSGIGVISGWACGPRHIVVEFNGDEALRFDVPTGSRRDDVVERTRCTKTHTGFGLLFNWNLLGDGEHTMRIRYKNGNNFWNYWRWWKDAEGEILEIPFTVTTLGEEFPEGLAGECVVPAFPDPGQTTRLEWSESLQNFVVVE